MRLAVAVVLAVLTLGCTTQQGQQAVNAYEAYTKQPRVDRLYHLTNVDEITIKGKGMEIEVNTPLIPLSVLSQSDSTWDNIRQIIGIGAGAYFGSAAIHDLTKRPQVVQQQVVEPTVIQVPQ